MIERFDCAPRLGPLDVHVWVLPLDGGILPEPELERVLSPDEIARADRFVFPHLRRRYVAARGGLRLLLGAYLAVDPGSIGFDYLERGKPVLAPRHRSDLVFNLSHSDELAIVGVGRTHALGVDVERQREMPDAFAIAGRFFSPAELACLRALPIESRDESFFTCWTRKEAYIKAIGDGLSCPLDAFDVSFAPGEPPRILAMRNARHDDAAQWSLVGFRPADGYIGAVAVRRPACAVALRRLPADLAAARLDGPALPGRV